MFEVFIYIIIIMSIMMIIERVFPNKKYEQTSEWWIRALTFNVFQFGLVLVGNYTWERMLTGSSIISLNSGNAKLDGLIVYLINTWIFYWWHRVRHEFRPLWVLCHQLHHSPTRIEVITSFYKHPIEIISNSIIITILQYPLLGISVDASSWFTLYSATAEFFYHLNIRTPHWIGYFIQRPEMHRLHHVTDKIICKNYSDLPIWDILGGTFENPTDDECTTGFSNYKEKYVMQMILCRDILKKKYFDNYQITKTDILIFLLLILGCLNTVGFLTHSSNVKGIAFSTVASPLPFVFSSYNGIETFSTDFHLTTKLANGTSLSLKLDNKIYSKLTGPYNRRNVFGVVFSHGPFFNTKNMIEMRDNVLKYGFCNNGPLAKDFDIQSLILHVDITIKSKTVGNENELWTMFVNCKE